MKINWLIYFLDNFINQSTPNRTMGSPGQSSVSSNDMEGNNYYLKEAFETWQNGNLISFI